MNKTTDEVANIIKNSDIMAFTEEFGTIEELINFKDTSNNDNLFHLIAKYGNRDFAKKVFSTYEPHDEKAVNELLLEKNSDGLIPARVNIDSHKLYISVQEFQQKQDVSSFLKRTTKQYLNQENAHEKPLYKSGTFYKTGVPFDTISSNSFESSYAIFPTIRLIKYNFKENKNLGLDENENDTDYINFKDKIYSEGDDNKKTFLGYNIGESFDIGKIPMSSTSLASEAVKRIPFVEDFYKNIEILDQLGHEIKSGYKTQDINLLYKNFAMSGGVFVIENENMEFMDANTREESSYGGYFGKEREHKGAEKTPIIGIPSNSKGGRLKHVMDHELTHAADKGFSDFKIMDYFITLEAGKSSYNSEISTLLERTIDNEISPHYYILTINITFFCPINKQKNV